MSKDLFEYIKEQLNLDYVSDIRKLRHSKELRILIDRIPKQEYPEEQWADLEQYIK